MARIRAGNLDRRITIQVASEMNDSFGEPIKTWTTFATVWAAFEAVSGNEAFTVEQRRSRASVMFRTRYRAGVIPKMRVLSRGETYEIDDVSEPDRNHEIVLTCHAFESASGT